MILKSLKMIQLIWNQARKNQRKAVAKSCFPSGEVPSVFCFKRIFNLSEFLFKSLSLNRTCSLMVFKWQLPDQSFITRAHLFLDVCKTWFSLNSLSKKSLIFVFQTRMGRRRSRRKPPPKNKLVEPLPTNFACPFCNHEKSCEGNRLKKLFEDISKGVFNEN